LAERIEKPAAIFANVLLCLAGVISLVAVAPALWALVGEGTLVAMTIFAVAGLIVGHFLGGPEPSHSIVLALSTACRHPAIAMAIAAAAFLTNTSARRLFSICWWESSSAFRTSPMSGSRPIGSLKLRRTMSKHRIMHTTPF
jgi:hypothetical protein